MVKKIYYEKRGRRYRPVSEYDSTFMDALPKGSHLVCVYPGGKSTLYNVEPNYAALIAAGRVAEDAVSRAIHQKTEIRRRGETGKPLTKGQLEAWNNLIQEFGDGAKQLEWASVRECAEAGTRAMIEEADKLMQHEAVRLAYEHFLLVCEICRKAENE